MTDEQIASLARKHLSTIRHCFFTRWKDGIDIQYPVVEIERFARAILAANSPDGTQHAICAQQPQGWKLVQENATPSRWAQTGSIPSAPVAAAPDRPQESQGDLQPEVRLNDDGTLDEVCGSGTFHLEQMSGTHWWLGVQTGEQFVHINLTTKRGKISAFHERELHAAIKDARSDEQKSPDRPAQECKRRVLDLRDQIYRSAKNTPLRSDHIGDCIVAIYAAIDRLAALPQECAAVLMELVAMHEAGSNEWIDRKNAAWAAARALDGQMAEAPWPLSSDPA